jgi:HNH endonuclease
VNTFYPTVAQRAMHRCEYCRAPEQVFNFAFEVEHIHPRSENGSNDSNNLALACESCNLFKSNAIVGWDEETSQESRLFNPRNDDWDIHFRFDEATMQIEGLTPIGRATIGRLRMNSDFQRRARQHWTQLNLYP